MNIEHDIRQRLADLGVTPLLGGLIPESAAAILLGYAPGYMRQQASKGLSPLPFIQRGNRRLYRIEDIKRFVTETA